jgi:hypothetical protein
MDRERRRCRSGTGCVMPGSYHPALVAPDGAARPVVASVRRPYHCSMTKVIGLLEKMGLVYRDQDSADPAGGEDATPATPDAAPSGARPGSPPRGQLAPPIELDTAALEKQPQGEEYALEQVYSSAGIKAPANGFTVYRLIEMLEGEEFRGLDAPTRARVITGMLKRLPTGPVEIEEIVRDAAARDRALDAFERFLADRVARTEGEIEEKNQALQQQIDELTKTNNDLMKANRASIEQERAQLARWRERKLAEENRLYGAVAPFVEHNPITREADSPPPVEPVKR